MPSYVTPKRATEYIFYISLVSQANTKVFQSNPTIAAGDFKVSIDGGALANPATLPAVTPASSKMVKITLSIAEMTGDNITVVCSDASGAEWCDLTINIQTSVRQIDELSFPTTPGRSTDVTATGAVGIDWGNVENPTTSLALTGTTVAVTQKVDVDTIKTNPVVNAGTVTFPTTATLASTTNITAGTITTVTNLTNAPTAGDLTAAMKASVNTEVDTALADVNLDHLAGTAASIPAIPAGTYIDQMMDDGTAVYDRTTDSLQAIRDRGDAAWTTGAGGSNPEVLITTTITNLISQQLFDLTDFAPDDGAYQGMLVVIEDASTPDQKCVGEVLIYQAPTLSLKEDPGIFTIANGDTISIIADRSLKPTVHGRTADITSTGAVGIDWGNMENKTTTNVLSGTTIGVVTLLNGLAAGVINAAAIATAAANKLADHILRRKQASVEASSDGDAIADAGSMYGFIQQAQKSNTVDNAGFLTVYETDGVTELEQIPLDTDAAADPVVGAG